MKANVTYNDFVGTAAADISDNLGIAGGDNIKGLAKYFNLDEERFEAVGIKIGGTEDFYLSLICIDNEKSIENKKHIVQLSLNMQKNSDILKHLFKRFEVVLHDMFDNRMAEIDNYEHLEFDDFHDT